MIKISYLACVLFLQLCGSVIAGTIPDGLREVGEGEVFYLKFIKVYDATLYSSDISKESILSDDVSKCLHLIYAVDIDRDDFIKAATTVLNRQFSEDHLRAFGDSIDLIHEGYRDVSEKDSYTLCYNSKEHRTSLHYNGQEIVTVMEPGFSALYFSIWLGSHQPLDDDLRNDLLAGLEKDQRK